MHAEPAAKPGHQAEEAHRRPAWGLCWTACTLARLARTARVVCMLEPARWGSSPCFGAAGRREMLMRRLGLCCIPSWVVRPAREGSMSQQAWRRAVGVRHCGRLGSLPAVLVV